MLIVQQELPKEYAQAIRRIIVSWAYLEASLEKCCYAVVGVDDLVGRVLLREAPPHQQVIFIEEIAFLRGLPLNEETTKSLRKQFKEVSEWRNRLAHGIWINVPDQGWSVRETRGKLPQEAGLDGHAKKRKITPEAIPVSLQLLVELQENLQILIRNVRALEPAILGMIKEQQLKD